MTEAKKTPSSNRVGQRMKPRGPQPVAEETVSEDTVQEGSAPEATEEAQEEQETPTKQEAEAEQAETDPALADLQEKLAASESEKVEDLQPDGNAQAEPPFIIHASTGPFDINARDLRPGSMIHVTEIAQLDRVGPLPNGDFAVVISIPEYFVVSVKDFAEAEKKTIEEWSSEFFNMNLEAYCKPNKGR